MRRELEGQRPRERDHGSLRGVIDGQPRPWTNARGTGSVEYHTSAVRLHVRNRRAATVENAPDVHSHNALEQRIVGIFERGETLRDSRVVEQDVKPAVALHG